MFSKFKGRYAEKTATSSERDVMSYEDMPLDDYEFEKTEMSLTAVKKIIICICIALAAGLIVFAFANRSRLTPQSIANWWTYDVLGNAGNGYPVELVGTEVSTNNFVLSEGRIAYASDTSFVTLSSSGAEIGNIQLKYSTPVMVNNGSKFLTYGLGEKGFQIDTVDKQLYEKQADEKIYAADITANGTYALVTEGNGYFSTLWVFNEDNDRIYKYSFSEYYITTVTLNSDGSGCVVTGFSSENGAVVSAVYVLDFKKEEPTQILKIADDMIIACQHIANNKVALVGEMASYVIKKGDENYITNSYNDMTLSNYIFNPDTSSYAVALSRSGDGRSCTVNQYNSNGDMTSSVDTNNRADSISLYKDKIALLDGNTACVYNTKGNALFSKDVGTGSKRIILSSDTTAYVLSVNQVRFVEFNKSSTDDTAK